MVKSLITGVSGFVGSHLAEYLLAQGEEVHGIKRWRSPLKNIEHILPQLTLHDADLLEKDSLVKVLKEVRPDYIYHLAAQSYVTYSFTAPDQTMAVNAGGTQNLYEAVLSSGIKVKAIQFCGTSEVYGQVTQEDVPIKETQKFNPQSPYGASKAAADIISKMFFEIHGLPIIRTRSFTHSGPRRGKVFVISAFAKQIAEIEVGKKKEARIEVGNLDSIRTFMDARDTVKAYYLLLRHGILGEVYNIGGKTTMSIKEMLDILLSMTSFKIEIYKNPLLLRKSDVTLQIPDCSKLESTIDWEPSIPFEKTLKDTLDYWRKEVRL